MNEVRNAVWPIALTGTNALLGDVVAFLRCSTKPHTSDR